MRSISNDIIELLNKGHEAAFEVVFSAYYPRLVYFAKEYVSYEDAKNLVQDTFLSFWEKKPNVMNEQHLHPLFKELCIIKFNHIASFFK